MNKHTPGPWMFCGRDILSLHAMPKASGPLVAIIDDNDDRFTKADAHLIAAAPDLLESTDSLLRFIDEHQFHQSGDDVMFPWPPLRDLTEKMRAAIAKAKGEQ